MQSRRSKTRFSWYFQPCRKSNTGKHTIIVVSLFGAWMSHYLLKQKTILSSPRIQIFHTTRALQLTSTSFFKILGYIYPVCITLFHLVRHAKLPSWIIIFYWSFHNHDTAPLKLYKTYYTLGTNYRKCFKEVIFFFPAIIQEVRETNLISSKWLLLHITSLKGIHFLYHLFIGYKPSKAKNTKTLSVQCHNKVCTDNLEIRHTRRTSPKEDVDNTVSSSGVLHC